jgi:hypothetical protein
VEIPMVCVTTAAGLGVLGVVIPWLFEVADTTAVNNISIVFPVNSFGIFSIFK